MTSEEFQELVSKIKQPKNEWRIERVLTFDGKVGDQPYQEWEEIVLHNSAELKYKDDVVVAAKGKFLRIFLDKMYPKRDFKQEEWEEMRQLLGYREEKKEKQTNSSNFPYKGLAILLGISFLMLLVTIVFHKIKKRN